MAVEPDQVAGLLAAEEQPLSAERLEDVTVADVGDEDANASLLHQAVKAEVGHRGDGYPLHPEMEGEDREDLVAVDRLSALVDREHPVTVPVEGDPEVEVLLANDVGQRAEVGGAAADVDVRPVRIVPDRGDVRAKVLEGVWREARVGPVRAVDGDPEAAQVRAEAFEHELEVSVSGDLDPVDLAAAGRRGVEKCLDLLLGVVRQLAALVVEELDPVVLRRVVRGRDDGGEVEPEQRDRRRGQHAGENGRSSRGGDPLRKRRLERGAARARVAAHEDAAPARPERSRLTEPLHEIRRERLADDATDAVRPEVVPRHGAGR